jgi:hypothetical protein
MIWISNIIGHGLFMFEVIICFVGRNVGHPSLFKLSFLNDTEQMELGSSGVFLSSWSMTVFPWIPV